MGDGTTDNRYTPRQIGTDSDWFVLTDTGISSLSAGDFHVLSLKSNRTLWVWGRNQYGQLGDGTTNNRGTPRRIGIDSDWLTVKAGDKHSVALKGSGGNGATIWLWGLNGTGQLGFGDTINRNIPCTLGAPALPLDLVVSVISTTQTSLSWADNSSNETGFRIERKLMEDGVFQAVATVATNVNSWLDNGPFSTGTYYYRVSGWNNE